MKIKFTDLWYWAIDIVTIFSFIAFLSGTGDLFDLAFFAFVVVPRCRKFASIDNGLIGYIRENLIDVTIEEEQE